MRCVIYTIAAATLAFWLIGSMATAQQGGSTQQAMLRVPPAIPIKSWADAFSLKRKTCHRQKATQSQQAGLCSYRIQDKCRA